jgi:LytS/YehU family sensor histidine kinase
MKLLWWIAGADPDILEQSHAGDRMKYSAIGFSILLTSFAEVLQAIAAEIINHTKQQLLKLVSKYRLPRSIKTAVKQQQNSAAEKVYIAQKQEQETQRKVNQFVADATQTLRKFVNGFF